MDADKVSASKKGDDNTIKYVAVVVLFVMGMSIFGSNRWIRQQPPKEKPKTKSSPGSGSTKSDIPDKSASEKPKTPPTKPASSSPSRSPLQPSSSGPPSGKEPKEPKVSAAPTKAGEKSDSRPGDISPTSKLASIRHEKGFFIYWQDNENKIRMTNLLPKKKWAVSDVTVGNGLARKDTPLAAVYRFKQGKPTHDLYYFDENNFLTKATCQYKEPGSPYKLLTIWSTKEDNNSLHPASDLTAVIDDRGATQIFMQAENGHLLHCEQSEISSFHEEIDDLGPISPGLALAATFTKGQLFVFYQSPGHRAFRFTAYKNNKVYDQRDIAILTDILPPSFSILAWEEASTSTLHLYFTNQYDGLLQRIVYTDNYFHVEPVSSLQSQKLGKDCALAGLAWGKPGMDSEGRLYVRLGRGKGGLMEVGFQDDEQDKWEVTTQNIPAAAGA